MEKAMFWLTVVIVSIVGIWAFKAIAGATGSQGLKQFAASI